MNLSGRVLVVDDEAGLRHTLTRILKLAGCEVNCAEDGFEALRLLGANRYDLVYLDIRLPGMDGLQTLRDIRATSPQLPVILLTAYGSLSTALEALRLGATDYLLKPLDPDVFIARTRMILQEQVIERRRQEINEQIELLQAELKALDAKYPSSSESAQDETVKLPEQRFLKHGGLVLDLQARRGTFGANFISLPPTTFEYLVALLQHSPEAVSYQTLVTEAQGYQVEGKEARELAKYHIHVLRQALEENPKKPQHVLNVRGVGYRLLVD